MPTKPYAKQDAENGQQLGSVRGSEALPRTPLLAILSILLVADVLQEIVGGDLMTQSLC